MIRALPTLAALLTLWGCASSERSPSTLQRYDKMRRELDWITAASKHVSVDAQRLEIAMSRANTPGVRAAAVGLKIDARQYSRRAGAAGNAVRTLERVALSRAVKNYFSAVTAALSWQWDEGVALSFVADQAWSDPLSAGANAARRLAADVAWARKAAQRAIGASAVARGIRRNAKKQFRYAVATSG